MEGKAGETGVDKEGGGGRGGGEDGGEEGGQGQRFASWTKPSL